MTDLAVASGSEPTVPDRWIRSVRSGVLDLETGGPLPDLIDIPAGGARVLVRLGGRPLGTVDLGGSTPTLAAAGLATIVEGGLAAELDRAYEQTQGGRGGRPALDADGLGVEVAEREPSIAGDVTVVVATRDRPETLARCLDSILDARPAPAAVVVVDNAPSDSRTEELVRKFARADDRVRYVREPRPGLGRAHNAGLPSVTTSLVAFTDDDVRVDPGWIGAIADAFAEGGPEVACVTGLIAPAELTCREQWWMETGSGFAKGFERRVRSLDRRSGESALFPYDAGTFGSGANMAFRTAYLEEAGGFDPSLGTGTIALGGDDLAAFHQVVASGRTLVYEPTAIVFHRHHADRAALERQAYGYGAGLTAYLASAIAARPGAVVGILARSVRGLGHVFRADSPLNDRRAEDHPHQLVRRERRGMLAGPFRYARQRFRDRGDR